MKKSGAEETGTTVANLKKRFGRWKPGTGCGCESNGQYRRWLVLTALRQLLVWKESVAVSIPRGQRLFGH